MPVTRASQALWAYLNLSCPLCSRKPPICLLPPPLTSAPGLGSRWLRGPGCRLAKSGQTGSSTHPQPSSSVSPRGAWVLPECNAKGIPAQRPHTRTIKLRACGPGPRKRKPHPQVLRTRWSHGNDSQPRHLPPASTPSSKDAGSEGHAGRSPSYLSPGLGCGQCVLPSTAAQVLPLPGPADRPHPVLRPRSHPVSPTRAGARPAPPRRPDPDMPRSRQKQQVAGLGAELAGDPAQAG